MKTLFRSTYHQKDKCWPQRGSVLFERIKSEMKTLFRSTYDKNEKIFAAEWLCNIWKNKVSNEKIFQFNVL